ncbi:MAG: hypothetical protein GQ574_26290 [Crocinitomix sp.]|nr:hypothetical protein [Crocinitomix sp.]
MNTIKLSNIKVENLSPLDFYRNESYLQFGVNNGSSTLVPFYIDILREAIGEKVDSVQNDLPLSKEEITTIKNLFIDLIDETLHLKETLTPYHFKLFWKEEEYDLNLSLTSPHNRRIRDFHSIVTICEQCLNENKPMYLSIE